MPLASRRHCHTSLLQAAGDDITFKRLGKGGKAPRVIHPPSEDEDDDDKDDDAVQSNSASEDTDTICFKDVALNTSWNSCTQDMHSSS